MKKVSVIVPVYKGKKYIKGLINQLETCTEAGGEAVKTELVLVNDDPGDSISDYYQLQRIDVQVIETDRNRGIHGARARGLRYSTGEYIVFLDQDDKIYPNYLKSQLSCLGMADAVICRAANGGRQFYNHDLKFEEAVSFSHMCKKGNGILSPGQVLLRRSAIPTVWKDNILRHNGADDWLLWLCMMNENKIFSLNQEVLYEHIIDGSNCSESTLSMYESEKEVYEVIRNSGRFCEECLDQFRQAVENGIETRLKELDRLKKITATYGKWVSANAQNDSISIYLKHACYSAIGIYGMGKMGIQLYHTLKTKLRIVCFIDRNAPFLNADIPVCQLEDVPSQLDLIILTLADKDGRLSKEISAKTKIPIKSMDNILGDILLERETW